MNTMGVIVPCESTEDVKKIEKLGRILEKGEAVFVLRGQDVLAPILVRTWALAQKWLEERQRLGLSVVDSVDQLDHRLMEAFKDVSIAEPSPKVLGAFSVADEMWAYSGTKKIAD